MSFKYTVRDSQGNQAATIIEEATGQSAVMRAAVYVKTPDMPIDPLLTDQWYISDANILPVWKDYTGKGIRIGQFEPGGPFAATREILDFRHPDLKENIDPAWLADPVNRAGAGSGDRFSTHATLVAGVMAADRNGEGAVGVAYDATVAGYFINEEEVKSESGGDLMKMKSYDIANNSWGGEGNFNWKFEPVGTLASQYLEAARDGRGGLGTVIVQGGGNDRQKGGDTNYSNFSNNRLTIVTGAINAGADVSTLVIGQKPFSNPGASILVSAPGSNVVSTSRMIENDQSSVFGNDYDTVQGTSFATPIVSGIVALMLEANPNLGYRDVQEILALTAKKVNDPTAAWTDNHATNWNGGAMHVSHDYGFGEVDARAAVRLAETWLQRNTLTNEHSLASPPSSGTINLAIPDNNPTGMSNSLTVNADILVEHAEVTINLTHAHAGDLIVKLISPSGTESVLINRPGKAPGSSAADTGDAGFAGSTTLNYVLSTTHDWGETASGTWTLKVIDAASGNTGTLTSWSLNLYGKGAGGDDTYVYTDEYGSLAGRNVLTDTDGGKDIINASAVSGNSTINLNAGATSTIAGKSFTIASGTDIEFAFGGDGSDVLTGNALSNRMQGGRGNDTLSGGGQMDLLDGGQGNDTLTGGDGPDYFVIRKDADSVDTITDFTTGTVEKILLVGFDDITDYSQIGVTQEGANTRLNLGNGQSILLLSTAPSAISEQNFGFFSDGAMLERYTEYISDTVLYWGSAGNEIGLLPNNLGDMRYFALGGDDRIGAQTTNDLIDGGNGNDAIWGDYPGHAPTPGADWLEGGAGNDTIYGGPENDLLLGGSGNDVLFGETGNDLLHGATGNDELYGGDGNDILMGGAGNDYMEGAAGNDTLFLEGDLGTVSGDIFTYYGTRVGGPGADIFKVTRNGGGDDGISTSGQDVTAYNLVADFDTDQAGEMIDLTAMTWIRGFEDLSITTALVIDGAPVTRIGATDGTNNLTINLYGVDADELNASHFVFASLPGLVLGGTGNDSIVGDAGGNLLDGGPGADTMEGRTGDDTYMVDNSGDVVVELPDGGYDTIKTGISYTLPANVENLVLTGNGNISGTGNSLANRITGTSGNNVLDGGAGADVMIGYGGNDTYIADNGSDRIIEQENGGTDTVQSSVSFTLARNIENLTLTGTDSINATGNAANNTLTGNGGDNRLDGGTGADTMMGGDGNDMYFIDQAGDVVTEEADEGIDTVYAEIGYTLGANVENLVLSGSVAVNGTGNGLDNELIGNALSNTLTGLAGNDYLDGGAGADTMRGGLGNDTYVVDQAGDVVTEAPNEGTDSVYTAINYTAGNNIENVVLTGTTATTATGNILDNELIGNALNNTLTGLAGNDYLDGGAGADTMRGGLGNDTYSVDNAGDVVTENAGEGTDTVQSSRTYTLGTNVENLTLTGTSTINGTGNALDNVLTGNSANNTLSGADGNDVLYGNAGNDTLNGGAGNDTYTFSLNGGNDTVTDAGADSTTQDKVLFTNDVLQNTVALFQDGQNLIVGYGSTDAITITNQAASDYEVEKIQLDNGLFLTNDDVNLVIQQMTAFAADHGIALTSIADVRANQDLMNIVVSAWHG